MNIYNVPVSGGVFCDLEVLQIEVERAYQCGKKMHIALDFESAPYCKEYNIAGFGDPIFNIVLPNGWVATWFRWYECFDMAHIVSVFVEPVDMAGWLLENGVTCDLRRSATQPRRIEMPTVELHGFSLEWHDTTSRLISKRTTGQRGGMIVAHTLDRGTLIAMWDGALPRTVVEQAKLWRPITTDEWFSLSHQLEKRGIKFNTTLETTQLYLPLG